MGRRTRGAVLGAVLASVAAVPASAAPPSVVRTGGPSAPADAAAELCGIGSQPGCSFLREAAGHAARRASFVAGLGPGAPVHVHHWAGRSPARLRGAVVGGPTTPSVLREEHIRYRQNRFDGPAGVYEDRAADYVTSEPAIVYAASAVLLFAAMAT